MTKKVYTLSIEPTEGETFQHGFHLGTDLKLARQIAEEKFNARNASGMPTRTVALFRGAVRDGDMVDVYDGQWASAYDVQWDECEALNGAGGPPDPIIQKAVDLKKELETDTMPELQAAVKKPMEEIMKLLLGAVKAPPDQKPQ